MDTGLAQFYVYPEDFQLFAHHYDFVKRTLSRVNVGGYRQFPMKLAYAVTMHKGQGQTVDAANVAPFCTNPGQCYVALSRVRDIKMMHLLQPLDASNDICGPCGLGILYQPEGQSACFCCFCYSDR